MKYYSLSLHNYPPPKKKKNHTILELIPKLNYLEFTVKLRLRTEMDVIKQEFIASGIVKFSANDSLYVLKKGSLG